MNSGAQRHSGTRQTQRTAANLAGSSCTSRNGITAINDEEKGMTMEEHYYQPSGWDSEVIYWAKYPEEVENVDTDLYVGE